MVSPQRALITDVAALLAKIIHPYLNWDYSITKREGKPVTSKQVHQNTKNSTLVFVGAF